MRVDTIRTTVLACCLAAGASACSHRAPKSPEALREATVQSLKQDDPAAAYALLADEVRAELPYATFEKMWNERAREREDLVERTKKVPPEATVLGGTTAHPGGRVLRWSEMDGQWYVADGLPGAPSTATPAQAVQALIEAVRATDFSAIVALLGEDLAARLDEDWQMRAEQLQAALDRPGSIELSQDLRRAELRYGEDQVLTLEQTPRGWRITGLQ